MFSAALEQVLISADDEFTLFAANETLGSGDDFNKVYSFSTDHADQLRVEAVDIHAASGLNKHSLRGIILSTSLGLVTNSSWRCIENNGSALPDPTEWPFAEERDSDININKSEILPNARRIWAPKLPSGRDPSKVVCLPSPTPAVITTKGTMLLSRHTSPPI